MGARVKNVPLVVENCEVSGNFSETDGGGMTLIHCYPSMVSRSTFYGNGAASGGQLGIDGNVSMDPLFCGGPILDFTLKASSPCAPGNHPDGAPCGLIGAFGVGCGGVPVEVRSWGAIKSLYGD